MTKSDKELLDRFAIEAMKCMLSCPNKDFYVNTEDAIGHWSYEYAQAMYKYSKNSENIIDAK